MDIKESLISENLRLYNGVETVVHEVIVLIKISVTGKMTKVTTVERY